MTVVIIEDEPLTRMDLHLLLTRSGVEVLGEGGDGLDGIRLCKAHRPDVVLLDINMPNIDGITVAKILKRDNLCGAVVMVTAYSAEQYIEKAQGAGVDGYLVKPIDERMLLPTIKIALSKAKEQQQVQQELHSAVRNLEVRKTIERAKGFLMKKEGLTEERAYEKIRSLSMEKNCTMEDLSEIILLSMEVDA